VLRATSGSGPEPLLRGFADADAEDEWIAGEAKRLHATGVAFEEMAVLGRTNARLADYEEAFHDAGIPFQGSSLLERDAARRMLRMLERDGSTGVAARVRALAEEAGLLYSLPDKLGEREQTRQADLARLVRLAAEFDGEVDGYVELLRERFGESAGRGVHLLTLHRAKGLEWEAVFLPRVEEGELPVRRGDVAEERRLFYVGLTRAKRQLLVTWEGKPSRFLDELGVRAAAPSLPRAEKTNLPQSPAVQALRAWRLARARADEVPAYVVFNDRTLAELVARTPRTLAELAAVPGIGPAKLERYGPELLAQLTDVAA
jgi:DNA helicase II / ATP-dependent DNA helicase PcrA